MKSHIANSLVSIHHNLHASLVHPISWAISRYFPSFQNFLNDIGFFTNTSPHHFNDDPSIQLTLKTTHLHLQCLYYQAVDANFSSLERIIYEILKSIEPDLFNNKSTLSQTRRASVFSVSRKNLFHFSDPVYSNRLIFLTGRLKSEQTIF